MRTAERCLDGLDVHFLGLTQVCYASEQTQGAAWLLTGSVLYMLADLSLEAHQSA